MKKNFHAVKFRTNRTKYSLNRAAKVDEGGGGRRSPQKALNYRIRSAWPGRGVEDWTMAADQRNQFAIFAKGQMCILLCTCACVRVSRATDKSRSSIRVLVQPWIWRGEHGTKGALERKKGGIHGGGALLCDQEAAARKSRPPEIRLRVLKRIPSQFSKLRNCARFASLESHSFKGTEEFQPRF